MICPNCGNNMSDKRKRCERCGTDLTLYKKILRTSNLYYNDGLAKAKVRDLSGAIKSLKSSLELNKTNTDARNLLGLIYFEMGETVAALSEWVISKHFKAVDNDADEYINKVQSNPTKLDSLNQAIKRYNNALTFSKQGSDDLAMIQLKKVTQLNPHFIRAYQLLALLYMKAGDNERAKKCLIKAGKIDVSNTTTLRYMRELEVAAAAQKDPDSNPEAEQSSSIASTIMPISSYKEDKPNIMAFVNLVIGVIIGVAVTAFLVIPSIKKDMTADQNSSYVDYNSGLAGQQDKDQKIKQLQQDNDGLNKKVDQLQTEIDNFQVPDDKTALYEPLFDVANQYNAEMAKPEKDRDFTAIADKLLAVDETKLESASAKTLYDNMKSAMYPIVTLIHYTNGHDKYSAGKYADAITELKKAIDFDPQNVDAIYFMARSYDRSGDVVNATTYYNQVINNFPNSKRVPDAKNFLNLLKK
ncbi:MAG TPA: tetratricopeptide repeat protein [Mobilitalea sp.]|nr:tetratricopeptide repeat protein [Mobilitalea sp.]